jgi:hypothetical protein
MKRITPLITVEAIEPCLPFWTERLGFEVTATVPHDGAIGFAILARDGLELMYQTRASVEVDLEASGAPAGLAREMAAGTATLYATVRALDPVIEALGDTEVLVPRRKTFYGADEIFVRAPCGTVVGLAAHPEG